MSGHFALFLLLLLLRRDGSTLTMGHTDEDFFKDCPPTRCSDRGPEIRFPLRLESSPRRCGLGGTDLWCSGNATVLALSSGSYYVTAIDYKNKIVNITNHTWGSCPLQDLTSINITSSIYQAWDTFTVLNCSRNHTSYDPDGPIAGPFTCLTGEHGFIYTVYGWQTMHILPRDCMAISSGLLSGDQYSLAQAIEDFTRSRVFTLSFYDSFYNSSRSGTNFDEDLWDCENNGGRYRFSWMRNKTICTGKRNNGKRNHGSHVGLITGISIGVLAMIIMTVVLLFLYVIKKSDKDKETRMKVERFLAIFKEENPTRYSYAEIKKITKRFKQRIGQGGFGSVYKGELPNAIPVAVKMLEHSRGVGEDFINEVATIGRIHHFNIVRLLGFCSEGTRRALVYEFLPHESLEKFIFWKDRKMTRQPFSIEKLLNIAIGIAQGIEYLHQGCNQRILHFDIKPHNILLDDDFNPKISDFGLAKLCSRDYSMVTITAARGTIGYIAPEIYSRNFGTVSYKSDVYSFGMLLLEMVSGRRNIDPEFANESKVYYPEWIYDSLVQGESLGVAMEIECNEEIVKKLVIVALWCIQWSPTDRPSMTRVCQMLMGNLQSLEIPPKPFVSTDRSEDTAPIKE